MSEALNHERKTLTLVDYIKFWGETDPETPAFIFWGAAERRVLTRSDVLDLSSRFAYRLKEIGISPGDVICVVLPNSPERVVTMLGTIMAGAVSMNGQQLRTDGQDLIENLVKTKCKSIILESDQIAGEWKTCQSVVKVINKYSTYSKVESEQIPSLRYILFGKTKTCSEGFLELCKKEENKYVYESCSPKDTCVIFTTSGSTGYSKLVPQNHEAFIFPNSCGSTFDYLKSGELSLNIAPLGWMGGFPYHVLVFGMTRVLIDYLSGPVPDKQHFLWDIACKEDLSVMTLSPSWADMLLDKGEKHNCVPKADTVVVAGQPLNKATLRTLVKLSNRLITILYGSTETSLVSVLRIEKGDVDSYNDYDVGGILNGVDVKIVDKDLETVPNGQRGEILVRSPMVTVGYLGELGEDDVFLQDGWFRTKDIGFIDQRGHLFVEGRSSDAIMHGAYILYPRHLEEKLQTCPGVKEVVIVQVPDPVLHHEICACVIPEDGSVTEDDFKTFCQADIHIGRDSPLSVVPKFILFFKEFPLTNTQKLDRKLLADLAREKLNL